LDRRDVIQAFRQCEDLFEVVFDSFSGNVLDAMRNSARALDMDLAAARKSLRDPGTVLAIEPHQAAVMRQQFLWQQGLRCHLEQVEQSPWSHLKDVELERRIFERGWVHLPPEERARWLTSVRLFRCCSALPWPGDRASLVVTLDGREVIDETSFFLALGEAVNGPAGYFGAGLDALRDCFCGSFGVALPFTVKWAHSQYSKQAIGGFSEFVEVLSAAGTCVELS
jgi:RNAse (barnase) inhibitor barstar